MLQKRMGPSLATGQRAKYKFCGLGILQKRIGVAPSLATGQRAK